MDIVVHRFQIELDQIPAKISELESDLAEVRGQFDQDSERFEELKKACRAKEAELADSQEVIKIRDEKLYKIKTQKEYQAAISEIAETRRENKVLENEILQLMGDIEEVQKAVNEGQPGAEAKSKEVEEEKTLLEARHQELEKALADAKEVSQQKLKDVDEELIAVYLEAKRHNPDAIAYIERGACEGCNMSIRPQLVIEVLKQENLHACPSCRRLLFVKEEAVSPQEANGN